MKTTHDNLYKISIIFCGWLSPKYPQALNYMISEGFGQKILKFDLIMLKKAHTKRACGALRDRILTYKARSLTTPGRSLKSGRDPPPPHHTVTQ